MLTLVRRFLTVLSLALTALASGDAALAGDSIRYAQIIVSASVRGELLPCG